MKIALIFLGLLLGVCCIDDTFDGIKFRNDITNLVIDTDGGADDILAIAQLILAIRKGLVPNLKILGVTCVAGNTDIKNVPANVLKIMDVLNETNIPVYKGAHRPIIKQSESDDFFGSNGIGNVNNTVQNDDSLKPLYAVEFLVYIAELYAGDLTILALGPLTNIAQALRHSPAFRSNVKGITVMGGLWRGQGSSIPGGEFNFYFDPHATFIVFNDTNSDDLQPIEMFPFDIKLNKKIPLGWRKNIFGAISTPVVEFLNSIEKYTWNVYKNHSIDTWLFHDSLAAMLILTDSVVIHSEFHNLEAMHDGRSAGIVIIDYGDRTGAFKNTNIITKFNTTMYKQLMMDIFTN